MEVHNFARASHLVEVPLGQLQAVNRVCVVFPDCLVHRAEVVKVLSNSRRNVLLKGSTNVEGLLLAVLAPSELVGDAVDAALMAR